MDRQSKKPAASGWNLYWVYSDGLEDCFVVARNIRSAMKVECDMNGFEVCDVGAYHVCKIPETIAKRQLFNNKLRKVSWPWYGHEDLLKKLGAEFREVYGRHETLVDGVVYCQGSHPRVIGSKFLKEFRKNSLTASFEEDSYTESQNILFLLLGICVARCQEIEHYISHSFVLAVSAKDKSKYETINDLTNGWQRKTLGQLVRSIEESYELDTEFKGALDWFLEARNKLVHGLTTHPQYDIGSTWGQDEMIAFLSRFELVSRDVRKAFRACFLASMHFGNSYLIDEPNSHIKLTKKQKEEMSIFAHFFKLRMNE